MNNSNCSELVESEKGSKVAAAGEVCPEQTTDLTPFARLDDLLDEISDLKIRQHLFSFVPHEDLVEYILILRSKLGVGSVGTPAPVPAPKPVLTFGTIDRCLQMHVFSFLSVADLGACVRVSKDINQLAKNDVFWGEPLKFMLKELYVGAFWEDFGGTITTEEADGTLPVSERPLKPSAFRGWLEENFDGKLCCNSRSTVYALVLLRGEMNTTARSDPLYSWLFDDELSHRDYYKHAGGLALMGTIYQEAFFSNFAFAPDTNDDGLFVDMPKICLFDRQNRAPVKVTVTRMP